MNLRTIGYGIGKRQAKRPWAFVLGALLLTVLLLPGIPLLLHNVEPSLEKVLPQDMPEVKVMNDMRSQHGADMLYLVLTGDDVLSPASVTYMRTLSQHVASIQGVQAVMSAADILPDTQEAHAIDATRDPRLATFVSADRTVAVVMIRADTGASAERVKDVTDDIRASVAALEGENPYIQVQLTGFAAIDQATFAYIIRDFTSVTLISFLGMIIFLLFHYKGSVKKTVYSMVIMVLGLLWGLGLTGYLGIQLDVVTMVAAAMIMALGSSYGVNSVYHFYDDFLLQYPLHEAVPKFQEFLIIGLTGSAVTEVGGFLALLAGIMPSMRALGIILAIGITFALVASVLVLPALFMLIERRTHHGRQG